MSAYLFLLFVNLFRSHAFCFILHCKQDIPSLGRVDINNNNNNNRLDIVNIQSLSCDGMMG